MRRGNLKIVRPAGHLLPKTEEEGRDQGAVQESEIELNEFEHDSGTSPNRRPTLLFLPRFRAFVKTILVLITDRNSLLERRAESGRHGRKDQKHRRQVNLHLMHGFETASVMPPCFQGDWTIFLKRDCPRGPDSVQNQDKIPAGTGSVFVHSALRSSANCIDLAPS
jgi:hypothetical protein